MDIQATKLELMQLLLQTEEEDLLKKIQNLFKEKDLNTEKNIEIPKWQIEETLKRLKEIENGTIKTRSWEIAKKEIFNK